MWDARDVLHYFATGYPRDKNELEVTEFLCKSKPKHSKCKDKGPDRERKYPKGRIPWEVRWVPCRKEDAVKYMRATHNYDYYKRQFIEPENSKHKTHGKKQSKKHSTSSTPGPSQRTAAPAPDMPPARDLPMNPAMGAGLNMPGPYGPQSSQRPPRSESMQSIPEDASRDRDLQPGWQRAPMSHTSEGPGGLRPPYLPYDQETGSIPSEGSSRRSKMRSHSSRHSSRGNPPPSQMGEMADGMTGHGGVPSSSGSWRSDSSDGTLVPIPPECRMTSEMGMGLWMHADATGMPIYIGEPGMPWAPSPPPLTWSDDASTYSSGYS